MKRPFQLNDNLPLTKKSHMKIGENKPSGFIGEVVWRFHDFIHVYRSRDRDRRGEGRGGGGV